MTNKLYVIMRNDLASMNAGKAIAHGAHAANAFIHDWSKQEFYYDEIPNFLVNSIEAWKAESRQGFGTTIAVSADISTIHRLISDQEQNTFTFANTVFDPSYPVRDGRVTHLIPLVTCAYFFVPSGHSIPELESLPLVGNTVFDGESV